MLLALNYLMFWKENALKKEHQIIAFSKLNEKYFLTEFTKRAAHNILQQQ